MNMMMSAVTCENDKQSNMTAVMASRDHSIPICLPFSLP